MSSFAFPESPTPQQLPPPVASPVASPVGRTHTTDSSERNAAIAEARRSVKLPSSIPEQVKGERPYYHECYFRHCTSIIHLKEAVLVAEDLINASATFLAKVKEQNAQKELAPPSLAEGSAPFGFAFAWNELFQADVFQRPLAALRNESTWEERQTQIRRFSESVLQTCEQALFASNRLFKGRQPLHPDLIPIDNTTSFISQSYGALIHVWYSNTEAKKFIASQQAVADRITQLRLVGVHSPVTVSFILHTVTVTATPLVPINSNKRTIVDGPQLLRQMKQLETLVRAKGPFQLFEGADGRWYIADCSPAVRVESESQGETSNTARSQTFDVFPNIDDFPDTIRKAGRKMVDTVMVDLVESVQRYADSCGGLTAVKLHELVAARTISKAIHQHGFKVSYLYDLYEHQKMVSPAPGTILFLVKEGIVAEMVCRTIKEIVRAEVATIKLVPHPEAPCSAVAQFIVEMVNRCVFNVLTKEELWAPHVLSVLRIKFSTPENFTVPQVAVTKRTILGYLNARLGTVFEGGRFSRTSTVASVNSVVKPCAVVQLILAGRDAEAVVAAQSQWKRAVDIANPELQMASCRQQLQLFAVCKSESDVETAAAFVERKMEERSSDMPTKGDISGFLTEAWSALLGGASAGPKIIAVVRKHVTDITKKYQKGFVQKDQDVPLMIWRLFHAMRAVESLAAAERSGTTKPTAASGGVTLADELDDIRLSALDHWKRVVAKSADGGGGAWMTPFVLSDAYFGLLCDCLAQLVVQDGSTTTCAELLTVLQRAKTSRQRYVLLCNALQDCAVRTLSCESELPSNLKTFFVDIATECLHIHAAIYNETEVPFYVALMAYVCHDVLLKKRNNALNMRQAIDAMNFVDRMRFLLHKTVCGGRVEVKSGAEGNSKDDDAADATTEVVTAPSVALAPTLSTDVSTALRSDDDRFERERAFWSVLKSEEMLTLVAKVVMVLMDIGEWSYIKKVIAFTHHVVCEGKIDGYTKLTKAAHSCLEDAVRTLRVMLQTVDKLESYAKRSMSQKKEDRERSIAMRKKREASSIGKNLVFGSPLPFDIVLTAARECFECSLRHDNSVMPKIRPLPDHSVKTLIGLRALLAAAPVKSIFALSAVAVQSASFPPIKYSVMACGYGTRHIVICPDTQCIGLFWSRMWLVPSKMFESNCPLFAKVAAHYIFSQIRFSHLFFTIVGFSWGGVVAQCLAPMLPPTDAQFLLTFGSPAAFSNPKGVPTIMCHGHYIFDEDLTPHLIGAAALPHSRPRVIAKMEGLGAILPFPPSKRHLTSLSLYQYYGAHFFLLKKRGEMLEEINSSTLATSLDLRTQFVGVGPRHYLDLCVAIHKSRGGDEGSGQSLFSVALVAADKNSAASPAGNANNNNVKAWYPSEVPLLLTEISAEGLPVERLKQQLKIPSGVEPNVLLPELMLLTYPKVTAKILKGLLTIGEDYGFDSDGSANHQAVEQLLKCRNMDQLVFVFQSYVASSWCPEFVAHQMIEWSGAVQGLQKQSLLQSLVEMFVSKHSFLFTMCPETSKSSETGSLVDRLSKFMSEEDKAKFTQPLGYHLGWSIAFGSTLHAVEVSRVIQTILGGSCQGSGIADVHPRVAKNMFAPALRFTWTPPTPKNVAGGRSQQSVGRSGFLLVQWNMIDVLFDGSNASQSLLRGVEQCVWVVQDDYSFQHLQRSVDFADSTLKQIVIFFPPKAVEAPPAPVEGNSSMVAPATRERSAPQLTLQMRIKQFADSHSISFYDLQPQNPECVAGLIALLMKEMTSAIKLPINPMQLPRNVHVGSLYSHDEEELQRHIKKGAAFFIKPSTPNGQQATDENGTLQPGGKGRGAAAAAAAAISGGPTMSSKPQASISGGRVPAKK